MNSKRINKYLTERRTKLRRVINKCKKTLDKSPEGILRTTSSRGRPSYYWRQNKTDKKLRYIKKKDIAIARNLAQRDYYDTVLKRATEELDAIEKMITIISFGLFE